MKKNKKLVLKEKWQTALECVILMSAFIIVSTIDSDWTTGYINFVSILGMLIGGCVAVIRKFGDTTKYQ